MEMTWVAWVVRSEEDVRGEVVVEECKVLIDEVVVIVGVVGVVGCGGNVVSGVVVHLSAVAVVREVVSQRTDGSHHKQLLETDKLSMS
jgi:hypothetical protein